MKKICLLLSLVCFVGYGEMTSNAEENEKARSSQSASGAANVQTPIRRCATPTLPKEHKEIIQEELRLYERFYRSSDVNAMVGSTIIRVYFHVIRNGRLGNVSRKMIRQQIAALNKAYAPSRIRFILSRLDYTSNAKWFDGCFDPYYEDQMKKKLRRGGASILNIYTCQPTNPFIGWATFPYQYELNPVNDGVVIHHATLPGGSLPPLNLGATATHEVGHWLGLYHTFEGGCAAVNDGVDDTPAEDKASTSCIQQVDSCPLPGLDNIFNYMNYVEDACMTQFSKGQRSRIKSSWDLYRAGK
ncbi:MAG: zinc metalloprotease [Deltaproteobacteria bacterium]|nr:zinc metalloprotease [Deltaproteobacteria bacterium]